MRHRAHGKSQSWKPILQGDLACLACQSVRAILADLPAEASLASESSLAGGTAGLAILHGYLAEAGYGPNHVDAAHRFLQGALAAVTHKPTAASLYSGLTGIGWALAHLGRRLPNLDGEDALAEIDGALLNYLGQSRWVGPYDLIDGLVGFGVYALERLPWPAAVATLERVVGRLAQTAERRDDGVTWRTDPTWLAPETRAEIPLGGYNLGLAHGVPGVVALLGQACAAGVAAQTARPLAESAVHWLLAQQGFQGFGFWANPEAVSRPGRLAWCYGDPGVAAALLCTGRCLNAPTFQRQALAIARRAAKGSPEQAGVVDAGLCHGASGLGHLFNRAYQASGDEVLAEAARSWFGEALRMRRPGRGVGGYEAWVNGRGWTSELGLLTGAAGVALALLAATTLIEPEWDRVLLVSGIQP